MMPVTLTPHVWLDEQGVLDALAEASTPRLGKCALLVEREAKLSMRRGGKRSVRRRGKGGRFLKSKDMKQVPSHPGTPPHAQTKILRNSISTAKTARGTFIVGPTRQAHYGRVHEFGAVIPVTERMRRFLAAVKGMHLRKSTTSIHIPKRPFMRPALRRAKGRFALQFKNLNLARTRAGARLNSKKGQKK